MYTEKATAAHQSQPRRLHVQMRSSKHAAKTDKDLEHAFDSNGLNDRSFDDNRFDPPMIRVEGGVFERGVLGGLV